MKRAKSVKNAVISVSEFKAKALRLLSETASLGREYVITRKGVEVARVVPIESPYLQSRRGTLKGLAVVLGDIIHVDTTDDWEVLRT